MSYLVGDRLVAGEQCMAHAIAVHGTQPVTTCQLPSPSLRRPSLAYWSAWASAGRPPIILIRISKG